MAFTPVSGDLPPTLSTKFCVWIFTLTVSRCWHMSTLLCNVSSPKSQKIQVQKIHLPQSHFAQHFWKFIQFVLGFYKENRKLLWSRKIAWHQSLFSSVDLRNFSEIDFRDLVKGNGNPNPTIILDLGQF